MYTTQSLSSKNPGCLLFSVVEIVACWLRSVGIQNRKFESLHLIAKAHLSKDRYYYWYYYMYLLVKRNVQELETGCMEKVYYIATFSEIFVHPVKDCFSQKACNTVMVRTLETPQNLRHILQ